ncbi:hypothetical protein H6764_01515 [Candidatus Nomurabacteria bacterium]|nr:hypothetical protein [Candidatus Nomurabacteria bacterium]
MNLKIDSGKKYKGQGFVESLVAILVTGLASIALMAVAARTIREVVRNEQLDQLTQEAVKGGKILDYVVDEHNHGSDHTTLFPFNNVDEAKCVAIDGDINGANLYVGDKSDAGDVVCNYISPYSGVNPQDCLEGNESEVKIDSIDQQDLFRIMCIHPDSNASKGILVVKIYTGTLTCSTLNSNVTQILDPSRNCLIYEYTSVYNVL